RSSAALRRLSMTDSPPDAKPAPLLLLGAQRRSDFQESVSVGHLLRVGERPEVDRLLERVLLARLVAGLRLGRKGRGTECGGRGDDEFAAVGGVRTGHEGASERKREVPGIIRDATVCVVRTVPLFFVFYRCASARSANRRLASDRCRAPR